MPQAGAGARCIDRQVAVHRASDVKTSSPIDLASSARIITGEAGRSW